MRPITISVTGQALLHHGLELGGPDAGILRQFLGGADVAIANLEGAMAVEGAWPTKTKTLHLTDRTGLETLRALGFAALTHANNHAFDLGPPGIAATRSAVRQAGMSLTGSGIDAAEAARPALVEGQNGRVAILSVDFGPQPEIVYASEARAGINPLRMRRKAVVPPAEFEALRRIVAGLGDDRREAARAAVGYRASPAAPFEIFGTDVIEGDRYDNRFEPEPQDLIRLASALENARSTADLVMVAIHNHHWDPDWTRTPSWVTETARRLIDSGADLVVGTGSPILQGMSFHTGRPILAGLGNFIFHTRRAETYDRKGIDVWTSVACRLRFDLDTRACMSVEVLPLSAGRPVASPGAPAPAPIPLRGAEATRAFDRLTSTCSEEERACISLFQPDEG